MFHLVDLSSTSANTSFFAEPSEKDKNIQVLVGEDKVVVRDLRIEVGHKLTCDIASRTQLKKVCLYIHPFFPY